MPKEPKTVLALPEWLPHLGGLATFYAQLAQCRSHEGKRTTILTTQKDAIDPGWTGVDVVPLAAQKDAYFVRYCQWLPEGWEVAALSLATGAAMRDWLREHAGDDTVVFAAEFLGYASVLREPSLPPLVVTAHGSMGQIAARSQGGMSSPDAPLLRMLESDSLLRADVTTAYSPMNAREWTNTLGREIPCVDPPFYVYPKTDTTRKTNQPLCGVAIGRLQDWKGAQVLAAALDLLGSDAGRLRIDWYGSDTNTAPGGGSMAEYLANTYPGVWEKSLHWHGSKPREEVARHQAEADIALIPSSWDTLNFTVLEAMRTGTPVVVSTGAGASYLVQHGVNGFTFPADDERALAGLLREILKNAARLTGMSTMTQAKLEARFATASCANRYEALADRARNMRRSGARDLVGESAGMTLLPLMDELMRPDKLPERGGRELLQALTQKIGKRLGLD